MPHDTALIATVAVGLAVAFALGLVATRLEDLGYEPDADRSNAKLKMHWFTDAMMFEIRVILRDVNFSPEVRSEINHHIVERFTAAGIGIAHNSREVTYKLEAERDAAHAAPVLKGQSE